MLLSGIRTFLERKLWRLESQFPGDCMDNVVKNANKWGADFAKPAIARVCVAGSTGLESAAP